MMVRIRLIVWALAALVAFTLPAHAAADLSALNRLMDIALKSGESEARLVLSFNKAEALAIEPVFYEKSIQFDLKGAYISPAKRELAFNDPLVKQAALYQVAPDRVRTRIFLRDDPRGYKDKWTGQWTGGVYTLTLTRAAPAPLPAPTALEAPATPVEKLPEPPAGWADTLEKPSSQPEPAAVTEEAAAAPTPAAAPNNLGFLNYEAPAAPVAPSTGSMVARMVGSLALVLSLVLLLAWAGRKYLGKLNQLQGRNSVVKVLASGAIGVKKEIAVVDVAGELLILGIAGDTITLLSNAVTQEQADLLRRGAPRSAAAPAMARLPGENPTKAAWAPDLVNKALGALRIGKTAPKDHIVRALMDESDPDTFAGAFASLTGEKARGAAAPVAPAAPANRADLVSKVTSAIKERNGRLRIA
ncbi:MAG: flagellar biosynthetic protein FliO [Nitrospinae bacterium]|nr:flagellar biosynthetic protein FliO [Nitrospinota bacterium]